MWWQCERMSWLSYSGEVRAEVGESVVDESLYCTVDEVRWYGRRL